ncbi:hypothetical protein BS50DRAFT_640734 [Corynespora cassiicola Philippines]|uniref:Uncharacterized protein n=1 Tax=Corynespora cassiicola Philippines TaxID=1448308 RepID=A0A2T2N2X1_CORCC|nr:hypothetical protein BS50DRAFT_640734 [Corynespora cassiicola Philippines]
MKSFVIANILILLSLAISATVPTVQPPNGGDEDLKFYQVAVEKAGYDFDKQYQPGDTELAIEGGSHSEKRQSSCSAVTLACLACEARNIRNPQGILGCFFTWHNACIACSGANNGCTC